MEITEADIDSVTSTLRKTLISGETDTVREFEEAFAKYADSEFAIAVANGSVALELAFDCLDLQPGDEVILPSFAIISCLAPLLRMGLKPVFVDSDLLTWNANPDSILSLVTARTKAILLVHTYGLAVPVKEIREVCSSRNIFLIEDCAEAHGLINEGLTCGSTADIATFSFYSNKLITSGEGGMCVTSNAKLAEKLRKRRNLGFEPPRRFVHTELGFNFRLSGMQAALGLAQLERATENLKHKRDIAARYRKNIPENEFFAWQPQKTDTCENGYWIVGLLLKHRNLKAQTFQQVLQDAGVMTRPFFYPLHKQPVLIKYPEIETIELPNSEYLGEFGFYLPTGNGMPLGDVDKISEIFVSELDKAAQRI